MVSERKIKIVYKIKNGYVNYKSTSSDSTNIICIWITLKTKFLLYGNLF